MISLPANRSTIRIPVFMVVTVLIATNKTGAPEARLLLNYRPFLAYRIRARTAQRLSAAQGSRPHQAPPPKSYASRKICRTIAMSQVPSSSIRWVSSQESVGSRSLRTEPQAQFPSLLCPIEERQTGLQPHRKSHRSMASDSAVFTSSYCYRPGFHWLNGVSWICFDRS
jgi:hypothetical protein